jgi:hypothetical protein
MRIMLGVTLVLAVGLYKYFQSVSALHDVRAYHDADIPYFPHLSTARLDEFATYDRWTHGNAVVAMREFSRLYQETFLADADPERMMCRMQAARATAMKELYGLRMWLPNDASKSRRLATYANEIDATMATILREVATRRGVHGIEPHAGRLRVSDDLGVHPVDDVWD